jgi:tetratricopeptide (TPR) repeat protein
LKLVDEAAAQMRHDAVLHEFRSLVLFALQRYAESAATIHPVLQVGPGWDWKTLSSLYPNTDVYTHQLRALETARNKDPKAAEVHFLLGYHYLTCGYSDQALGEFRKALELRPNDSVSTALVATLSPRDAAPAQSPTGATPKAVPSDSIVGSWKARGKGASTYSLTLAKMAASPGDSRAAPPNRRSRASIRLKTTSWRWNPTAAASCLPSSRSRTRTLCTSR